MKSDLKIYIRMKYIRICVKIRRESRKVWQTTFDFSNYDLHDETHYKLNKAPEQQLLEQG